MSTAEECKSTYKRFFDIHNHHLDPVCLKAAMFCNTLTDWCGEWNVVLNVNKLAENHYEFLLFFEVAIPADTLGAHNGSHGDYTLYCVSP
jgi:hypothetical protein